MTRNIPNMGNRLLFFMDGKNGSEEDRTPEKYEESMINLEKKIEKDMIEVFSKMGINASVKTDRYSLPYKDEIVINIEGASYLNYAFTLKNITREIVKELIDKEIYKIRFYLTVDAIIENDTEDRFFFGRVVYKFRYVKH